MINMVKLIGVLLIVSSVLALIAGSYINAAHGGSAEITGNVITNVIAQPEVENNSFDYIAATALSYSIISLMMGLMFLFRV